ncbi:gamma-glutamyltransferase [bacterium]|jgi:gamma-glutamyltranspeptidase / glutathione hydrolase|nr:gamma-glutamyltransferase [bacterium]MDA7657308.1 gamma-glutamyltransferase [Verrucomicrobiota bacterium]
MNRRTFIKTGGVVSASALLGEQTVAANLHSGRSVPFDLQGAQSRNQNRSTVACQRGIVCSSQPLASQAGLDVLKKGGSAVDAAIAANAVLSVVEPMSNGPGGDLFAIGWDEASQSLYGLNASGRSPYNWNLNEVEKLGLTGIDPYSPLSWSVPGCVSGWEKLADKFGKLNRSELLADAIHYAREGFPISPIIAKGWVKSPSRSHPTLSDTYLPGGDRLGFGDIFKNPGIADFFEILSRDGWSAFYEGEIADRIVRFSKEQGGRFDLKDFQDHTADWVAPVSANYRGYDVWELPPNGQGIAALQILNMLEQFDMNSLGANSAEYLHLFLEAKKLAFEDRAIYYADMDFAEVPLQWLISKEYAQERAKMIDPKKAAQKVAAGRLKGGADTVYLTAADKDGNMVSFIQSVYHGWGSKYVPTGLGFALQNRGELFSLDPNDLNRLEPHKRPFHTIIPGFMTKDGRPLLSFGVMGGDFQPQGHAQVLMNMIDFGMSPQQAGEQPRIAHSESSKPTGVKSTGPGTVQLERGISDSVRDQLTQMGHHLNSSVGAFGGYQSIWRMDDPLRYFGGSDPRKDGCAIGY